MAKHAGAHKAEKRRKELMRQKKQEEKRKKRLQKGSHSYDKPVDSEIIPPVENASEEKEEQPV